MKISADRIANIERSKIRKIFDRAPKNAIDLGLGEIQFQTPKNLTDYAKNILDNETLKYTPNAGLTELHEKIAEHYAINFTENICVTVGAEEAIFATLFSHLNPNDEVLLANPAFIVYDSIVKMLGGTAVKFDLDATDNFRVNKKSFLQNISNKTKIVILNNPSNPTGVSFTNNEMNFIVNECKKRDVLLIVDEIYSELYLQNRPKSFLKIYKNVIVISGLSKSHCMSGWRVGWCISQNSALIKPIIKSHQFICTCAPSLSQKIAVKAFSFENSEIRKKLRKNYSFARKCIETNIPKLKMIKPDSAPYIFVKTDFDDVQLTEKLLRNGVIVMPGSIFGENGKTFLRLNYGLEKGILRKGLEVIAKNI